MGEVMKRYLREIYLLGVENTVTNKLPKLDSCTALEFFFCLTPHKGVSKMIEADMVLALSAAKEGTAGPDINNGIKSVIRYLTSFLRHFETVEDTTSKLIIANLECYRVVFLTEVTDPNHMTAVGK